MNDGVCAMSKCVSEDKNVGWCMCLGEVMELKQEVWVRLER